VKKLFVAAILLAAPLAARADAGVRLGLEANLVNHDSNTGTHWISDNWPFAGDIMLSYWTPGSIVSFDLELAEEFYFSTPAGSNTRIGTVIRPGVRISPPVIPFYIRAALPLNVENNGFDRALLDLRVGAGINIPLGVAKLYLEANADFPLSSKDTGTISTSAFSSQAFWLGAGLDFRL